jgi:hypothetical protein
MAAQKGAHFGKTIDPVAEFAELMPLIRVVDEFDRPPGPAHLFHKLL